MRSLNRNLDMDRSGLDAELASSHSIKGDITFPFLGLQMDL